MSPQDIVRITRIADRWISALEEARLDRLPAAVFVTGYVRSYARAVGLNEQDIIDRYHAFGQQQDSLRSKETKANKTFALTHRALLAFLLIASMVLAAIGLLMWRRHAT